MSINVNSFQYSPVNSHVEQHSVDSANIAALMEIENQISEQKAIVQSRRAEVHSLGEGIADDVAMLKALHREIEADVQDKEEAARKSQMISELDISISDRSVQKDKASAEMLQAAERMLEAEAQLKAMSGIDSSGSAAKASGASGAGKNNSLIPDLSSFDKILNIKKEYGIGMALGMLQMQQAQVANQHARMFLEEVKLVQDRAQSITEALQHARIIKSKLDAKEAVPGDSINKLNDLLKKDINLKMPLDTIKVDGKPLTKEMEALLGEYKIPSVPSFSSSGSDDYKKAAISATISSLSEWQDTYTSRVGTIMVDVNDHSSKYSSFMSGANQAMDKVINLLKKMVNTF